LGDIHYRQDWLSLKTMSREEATAAIDRTIGRTATHYQEAVAFAIGRLIEGRQVGEFFAMKLGRPLCILDVGAGNGGVSGGAANISGHKLHALDFVPNSTLRSLIHRTRLPV